MHLSLARPLLQGYCIHCAGLLEQQIVAGHVPKRGTLVMAQGVEVQSALEVHCTDGQALLLCSIVHGVVPWPPQVADQIALGALQRSFDSLSRP